MAFRTGAFLGNKTTVQIVNLPVEQRKIGNYVYDLTTGEFRLYAVDAEAYPSILVGGGGGVGVIQDILYIGPAGSDATGDGSISNPFLTLQKCYDTWFPAGHPTTWPEFDRKRTIIALPGTTAATSGNLVAECANLVIEGMGNAEVGDVTYAVKNEVFATFTGASSNYEMNTLTFEGKGLGYNTSSADAVFKVGTILVSNFNTAAREVMVNTLNCQVYGIKTQRRTLPGGFECPIYINSHDAIIIYCESGVGTGGDAGNMAMTFSMVHDCIFRNQVNATKGAIGFADMQGCYFRRGFVGDPGIAGMVGTGVFRGWEDNHINYAFNISSVAGQTVYMDYTTYQYMIEKASPNFGTNNVVIKGLLTGTTGNRPTIRCVGMQYFDTTLGYPIWWDGTQWVDAAGTPV